MMAIKKALTELAYRIPPQILRAIFLENNNRFIRKPLSIDEVIMARVIRPRVMVDCDITGGVDQFIDLSRLPAEMVDTSTWVIHVPKDRTQDRSIISVQGVSFIRPYSTYFAGAPVYNSGGLMQAASSVMAAQTPPPNTFTHKVELITENTVSITDLTALQPNMWLQCVLGSDENLSHLKMRYYQAFSRLVELAVKSYIYNEYIVEIDMAALHGGSGLGKFKDIVDEWRDAEQEYQLFLTEKWKKMMILNDDTTRKRFITSLIGLDR